MNREAARRAVVFKSERRWQAFRDCLEQYGYAVEVLDFDAPDWFEHDFSGVDVAVYFPDFAFTSNHPLALYRVHDHLAHLQRLFPQLQIFPDPAVVPFYCDKYRQHLFLRGRGYPYPETYALTSPAAVDLAAQRLGFPLVIKNRYGAGGDYVIKVDSRRQLEECYQLSMFDYFSVAGLKHALKTLSRRLFYYYLVKARRMPYPFFSAPLLAQRYMAHERDIKTVVGHGKVVEAHWRRKADARMWKVNIDGGGIGEWSHVPAEVIGLSERLAADLGASWLNIDILDSAGGFLITEFSPVWHHYAFREKPTFVYRDDYNIGVPLEIALDLERMVVEGFQRRPAGIVAQAAPAAAVGPSER